MFSFTSLRTICDACGARRAERESSTANSLGFALPLVALFLPGMLSACATPARMHTDAELSTIGRSCGASEGEVIQDAEEPKVLVFYAVAPPRAQIHCLAKWARHHHLHLAYIQGVDEPAQ